MGSFTVANLVCVLVTAGATMSGASVADAATGNVEGPVGVHLSDGDWDTYTFLEITESANEPGTQVACRWRSSITHQRDTADGGTVAVHFSNFYSFSQCNMSGAETKMRRMYVQTSVVQPNGSSVSVPAQGCTNANSQCDTLFESGPSFSRYPGTGQYNLKVSVIWALPESAGVWRTGNPHCTRDDTGKYLTCTKDHYFTIT